jgi:IS5 family transposase
MKHLKGWSFRDLERELRSNLVYRRFTCFDAEATPDFTTFSRTFALLSPRDQRTNSSAGGGPGA